MPQGARRQAVAAALVAREPGSVDNDDVPTRPGQDDGGSSTRRPAAHHDDVGLQHDPSVTGHPSRGPLTTQEKPVMSWPVCLS